MLLLTWLNLFFFCCLFQCARLMTQCSRLAWLMVQKMRSFFCQSFPFDSDFCISDGWWRIRCISCWFTECIWEPPRGEWKCILCIHQDTKWSEEVKKIQVWVQRQIHNTKIFTHSFNLTGYLTALISCRHVQSTWLSEGLRGPFRANIIQVSWKKALWGNANVQPWKKSEEELGRKRRLLSSSPLTETICFPPNSRCSFMELWCCSWLCRQVRTDFQSGLCSLTERWGLYVDMKQWGLKVKEIVQHLGNCLNVFLLDEQTDTPLVFM